MLLCCLDKTGSSGNYVKCGLVLQNPRPPNYSSKSRSTPAKARESAAVSRALAKSPSPSSWEKVSSPLHFCLIRIHCFLKNVNLWNGIYLLMVEFNNLFWILFSQVYWLSIDYLLVAKSAVVSGRLSALHFSIFQFSSLCYLFPFLLFKFVSKNFDCMCCLSYYRVVDHILLQWCMWNTGAKSNLKLWLLEVQISPIMKW